MPDGDLQPDFFIPGVTTHAHSRMMERHGRDLTPAEWLKVVLDIIDRRAVLVSVKVREDSVMECWAVRIGALTFRMIWAPLMARIVTVLPDEQGQIGWLGDHAAQQETGRVNLAPERVHWSRR